MADPITTSTAVAQGSGASGTANETTYGSKVVSPSRQSLGELIGQIDQLKADKKSVLDQIDALNQQKQKMLDRADYVNSLVWVPGVLPNGQPNPDRNAGHAEDPTKPGVPVDTANDPDPTDVAKQSNNIDVQVSNLLNRAAQIQQDVVQATQKRDEMTRQVATDEDPRTLDALTRAAQKEQLQLDADKAALDKNKADSEWEQAYRTNFSGADKAALDKNKASADTAAQKANAALVDVQTTGTDLDNQAKAITLKYADRTGAAGATRAEGEAVTATEAGKQASIKTTADQQAVDNNIGFWTAENQKQNALSSQATAGYTTAQTEGQTIKNQQDRQGEAVTRINQLREAIRSGSLTKEAAGDLYFNAVYGGDQFQRNKNASDNALALQRDLIQAGMAVRGDQQFIVGGEPGGAYQQGLAKLGYAYQPVALKPSSLPAWAQQAQVDISPRQGLPAGQPFSDTGDFNPAFASPLAAPAVPAWAQAQPAAAAQAQQPVIKDMRGGAFRAQFAQPAA